MTTTAEIRERHLLECQIDFGTNTYADIDDLVDQLMDDRRILLDSLERHQDVALTKIAELNTKLKAAENQIKAANHHPDCNYWKWEWEYSWHETDCNCPLPSKLEAVTAIAESSSKTIADMDAEYGVLQDKLERHQDVTFTKITELNTKLKAAEKGGDVARRGLNKITEMYDELESKLKTAEQKLKEISELSREWNDGKAAYDKYPVACWCADELQAIIGSKS